MQTPKHITTVLLMLFAISITAQQSINYKALVKDGSGNILANQGITIQFKILKGAGNQYKETHTPTTDANGLIILNIGEGTTNDDFTNIDWASDDHFLNVQIDTGGGLVDMGTTQFLAVPYALSALNALTSDNAATKIDELSDGKSDNDGSSVFLGLDAGLNDDGTNNANVGIGFNALRQNTTGFQNTANGSFALSSNTTGNSNTANGYNALYSNTTGYSNTANGRSALFNNTEGYSNTANGRNALYSNTEGYSNTANGRNALYSNTTGYDNTANGFEALFNNTEGFSNTANGYQALYSNTTGYSNIANGYQALYSNTTGYSNIANGRSALYSNTTGYSNTANGRNALFNNTEGFYNTANGRFALSSNTTGSNNIGIGYNAQVPNGTLDNQVRIGNTAITYAGIQVGWTVTSDKRWKENIRELPFGIDVVKQLNPVDYVRKNNEHKTREMGFIAQDVEALLTKIGYTDQGFLHKDDKGFMSLRYNDFIALLTKAIQEQQEIIESQNAKLEKQDKNYEKLLKRVEQLELVSNK